MSSGCEIGRTVAVPPSTPKVDSHSAEGRKIIDFPGPAPEPAPAEVSEDAIARLFTAAHGDNLRYDHDVGGWYEWTGARWQQERTKKALDYARLHARRLGAGRAGIGKASVAAGVERLAQADRAHAVRHDLWDSNPWLLGTPTGTVDLRTGTLREARREDYITKSVSVAPEGGTPTLWLSFLSEAADNDPQLVRFLQQWMGYCLTGLTNEHAMIFLYGPGGNGKSVFMNVLSRLMGDYAETASMETFTSSQHDRHSVELAVLCSARLVTASETEENRTFAEAKVKAVTGGDPITARFMRQNPFTFLPAFKLMMAGNHAPRLATVDEAIRRRFNLVPFIVKPKKPDKDLEQKLQHEFGRILNWATQGCLDWQANGLIRPPVVRRATEEYFNDQDGFGKWLSERCQTEGRGELFGAISLLHIDYLSFAEANDERQLSLKAFGMMMKKRGFEADTVRVDGKPQKVYRGIRLRRSATARGLK